MGARATLQGKARRSFSVMWNGSRPGAAGKAQEFRLVMRPKKSGFQFLFLLLPARVLRLQPSVECSAVLFDLFGVAFVFSRWPVLALFRLCDCLLASLALLLPIEHQ